MSKTTTKVIVSIIIPAFNEEECIVETLQAIARFPPTEQYEIIVVDNNSTDHTPTLVEENNAILLRHGKGTIAAVRNHGVTKSRGKILVFIDADVLVTENWANNLPGVINELLNNPMTLTGSRCLPQNNGNWFNHHWFARLAHNDAPYINSGHLITTRALFDKIGGFTEHLKTAEDYDFCMKAKNSGAIMVENSSLSVIHLGYPQTLKHFISRERWHGREDFETLASFAESKVGWAAVFNLFLFTIALVSVVFTGNLTSLLGYFVVIYLISIALTLYKFKSVDGGALLPTAAIFYIYLCGRSLALVDRFTKPPKI